MLCDNENILLEKSDFACVGQLANHCNKEKLCIAISEAQEFDVSKLFCDFWDEILFIWDEINNYHIALKSYEACILAGGTDCEMPIIPENYDLKINLLCGGTFVSCGEKQRRHLGVKRILVYYSYARYLILNEFNDTVNGNVKKTSDFALQQDQRALKDFADKYRSMGYDSFKKTINFLCVNKSLFEFNHKDCNKGCGCGHDECKGGTKAKGYGFKSTIISK